MSCTPGQCPDVEVDIGNCVVKGSNAVPKCSIYMFLLDLIWLFNLQISKYWRIKWVLNLLNLSFTRSVKPNTLYDLSCDPILKKKKCYNVLYETCKILITKFQIVAGILKLKFRASPSLPVGIKANSIQNRSDVIAIMPSATILKSICFLLWPQGLQITKISILVLLSSFRTSHKIILYTCFYFHI